MALGQPHDQRLQPPSRITEKPVTVIVGAGPAGLAAAIHAAAPNQCVYLLERLAEPARKLLASGGGHANLTNTAAPEEFFAAFGREGKFIRDAWRNLDNQGLRSFLAGLGVPTVVAADGFHVFPASHSASEVQQALLRRARDLGVELLTATRMQSLEMRDGRVATVITDRGPLPCHHLLLATGGRGYPGLGGASDGHAAATALGHHLTPPLPALVPLIVTMPWGKALAGVALAEVALAVDLPRRPASRGALLFTHHGLSGPAPLNLSREVSRALAQANPVPLRLNFTPGTDLATWVARCDTWARTHGRRQLQTLLAETLPKALVLALCATIPGLAGRDAAETTRAQRLAIAQALTQTRLLATATADFDQAMVTTGGVCLKEVDPRTLRSRLIPNLFFAGEILDLDGPCGGYNLQWAFSSGALAGNAMRNLA